MSGPCHFSSCKLNHCCFQLVLSPMILRGKNLFLKSLFFNPFHLDLQVILLFHCWIDDSWSYYLCANANALFKKNKTSLCPLLTCFSVLPIGFFLYSALEMPFQWEWLWVSLPPLAPPFLQGIILSRLFSANLLWLICTSKAGFFSVKLLLVHWEGFH